MEIELDLDLIKGYKFDVEDFYVLEAQRAADRFLWPEELAVIANVSVEKAREASKKITEVMMLSNMIERSKGQTDF